MMELSQPGPRRVYCVQDTYPKWSNTTSPWDTRRRAVAKRRRLVHRYSPRWEMAREWEIENMRLSDDKSGLETKF